MSTIKTTNTTLTQARTVQKRGFENGDGLSLGNSTLTYIISHRFFHPRRSLLILLFSTKPNKRLPDSIE
jgi:hypothetical protein